MLQFFLTHSPKNVASPTNLNALNSSYTFLDGVGKDIQTKNIYDGFFLKNRGHQLTFLWMRHLNFHKMSVMRLRRRQNIQFLWTVYCVYVRRPSEKKNLMQYWFSTAHGIYLLPIYNSREIDELLGLEPMIIRANWMLNPAWMLSLVEFRLFLEGDFRLLFRSHG